MRRFYLFFAFLLFIPFVLSKYTIPEIPLGQTTRFIFVVTGYGELISGASCEVNVFDDSGVQVLGLNAYEQSPGIYYFDVPPTLGEGFYSAVIVCSYLGTIGASQQDFYVASELAPSQRNRIISDVNVILSEKWGSHTASEIISEIRKIAESDIYPASIRVDYPQEISRDSVYVIKAFYEDINGQPILDANCYLYGDFIGEMSYDPLGFYYREVNFSDLGWIYYGVECDANGFAKRWVNLSTYVYQKPVITFLSASTKAHILDKIYYVAIVSWEGVDPKCYFVVLDENGVVAYRTDTFVPEKHVFSGSVSLPFYLIVDKNYSFGMVCGDSYEYVPLKVAPPRTLTSFSVGERIRSMQSWVIFFMVLVIMFMFLLFVYRYRYILVG